MVFLDFLKNFSLKNEGFKVLKTEKFPSSWRSWEYSFGLLDFYVLKTNLLIFP